MIPADRRECTPRIVEAAFLQHAIRRVVAVARGGTTAASLGWLHPIRQIPRIDQRHFLSDAVTGLFRSTPRLLCPIGPAPAKIGPTSSAKPAFGTDNSSIDVKSSQSGAIQNLNAAVSGPAWQAEAHTHQGDRACIGLDLFSLCLYLSHESSCFVGVPASCLRSQAVRRSQPESCRADLLFRTKYAAYKFHPPPSYPIGSLVTNRPTARDSTDCGNRRARFRCLADVR